MSCPSREQPAVLDLAGPPTPILAQVKTLLTVQMLHCRTQQRLDEILASSLFPRWLRTTLLPSTKLANHASDPSAWEA